MLTGSRRRKDDVDTTPAGIVGQGRASLNHTRRRPQIVDKDSQGCEDLVMEDSPMSNALKDADNLARLERLRPRYERLNEMRIRNAAEKERADRDLEDARRNAIEVAGTDDLDELRAMITENYEKNTRDLDAFERLITDIEARIKAVTEQGT